MRFRVVALSVAVWSSCFLFAHAQLFAPATESVQEKEAAKPTSRFVGGASGRGIFGQLFSKKSVDRGSAATGGAEKSAARSGGGVLMNPPEVSDEINIQIEGVDEPTAKKPREAAEPREGLLKKWEARKRTRGSASDAPQPIVSEDGSEVTIPDLDIPGEPAAKSPARAPATTPESTSSAAKSKFRWPFTRK